MREKRQKKKPPTPKGLLKHENKRESTNVLSSTSKVDIVIYSLN